MSNRSHGKQKQKLQSEPALLVQKKLHEELAAEYNLIPTESQQKFLDALGASRLGTDYLVRYASTTANLHRKGEMIRLSKIRTPEAYRGKEKAGEKGPASILLNTICEQADIHGITLVLNVDAEDVEKGLNNDQLKAWYERNGFVGHFNEMIRVPKQIDLT